MPKKTCPNKPVTLILYFSSDCSFEEYIKNYYKREPPTAVAIAAQAPIGEAMDEEGQDYELNITGTHCDYIITLLSH